MVLAPPGAAELVVDASVVIKWVKTAGEPQVAAARRIRTQHRSGALTAVAPSFLYLEILNVAARKWKWPLGRLNRLAARMRDLNLIIDEPSLERIAFWTDKGLTAYDACYVAVAELRKTVLVTTDAELIKIGGRFVRAL